jgi:hypothetical protein
MSDKPALIVPVEPVATAPAVYSITPEMRTRIIDGAVAQGRHGSARVLCVACRQWCDGFYEIRFDGGICKACAQPPNLTNWLDELRKRTRGRAAQ